MHTYHWASDRFLRDSCHPSRSHTGSTLWRGGALVYNPFIFYLDEWFVKRKGLAYGIFWAGTGVFSSVMPFIMHWALNRYGFRTPLRVWAVFVMRDYHHLLKLTDFPDNYIVLNFRNFDMLCQTTQATSC